MTLFKSFEVTTFKVTTFKVKTSLAFDRGPTKVFSYSGARKIISNFENVIQYWLTSFNQSCLVFQNNAHLPDCLGSVFFSCGSTCFNLLWSKVFTSALVSAASSLISKTTSFSLSISCGRYDHVTQGSSTGQGYCVLFLSKVLPLTLRSPQSQGRGTG